MFLCVCVLGFFSDGRKDINHSFGTGEAEDASDGAKLRLSGAVFITKIVMRCNFRIPWQIGLISKKICGALQCRSMPVMSDSSKLIRPQAFMNFVGDFGRKVDFF